MFFRYLIPDDPNACKEMKEYRWFASLAWTGERPCPRLSARKDVLSWFEVFENQQQVSPALLAVSGLVAPSQKKSGKEHMDDVFMEKVLILFYLLQ